MCLNNLYRLLIENMKCYNNFGKQFGSFKQYETYIDQVTQPFQP